MFVGELFASHWYPITPLTDSFEARICRPTLFPWRYCHRRPVVDTTARPFQTQKPIWSERRRGTTAAKPSSSSNLTFAHCTAIPTNGLLIASRFPTWSSFQTCIRPNHNKAISSIWSLSRVYGVGKYSDDRRGSCSLWKFCWRLESSLERSNSCRESLESSRRVRFDSAPQSNFCFTQPERLLTYTWFRVSLGKQSYGGNLIIPMYCHFMGYTT